jgi:Sigma-70 factor, region 1.1
VDPKEAALIDLIDLGRRRGSLTMEDFRKALPLDSMTVEDISHAIARLDQAGFDLEIDPTLLLPGHQSAPKDAVPVGRPEKMESPKPMREERRQQSSFPASADKPIPEKDKARGTPSSSSAPMLPWIVAFAIVVIAVFAAFAF